MDDFYDLDKPLEVNYNKVLKCDESSHTLFTPQAHQIRVTREFMTTNKRGLLFFHALGSGKTCAAYLAIDSWRKANPGTKVFILAPASLASSHKHQYCNVCGDTPHSFGKDFYFYSYNDRQGIIKKLPKDMSNSIVLIDEVQEIVNGKENASATLTHVYDTVLRSSNIKLILLSGTPIFTPFQCSLILNLLDPGITSRNPKIFEKDILQPDYLFEKCKGLISYVPIPNKSLYPSRIVPDIIETFPMSQYQFGEYRNMREKELDDITDFDKKIQGAAKHGNVKAVNILKAQQFIQSTRLKSRQICNFAYPKNIGNVSDLNADWIANDETFEHTKNLKEYSPKMAKVISRCLTLPGKHMVYGWFKSNHGLYLIYTYLKHCGLDPLLFSGDLGTDEKRAEIINKFNAPDNIRGEKHKVILVSGAGAMGISLFGIRHFHNFEAGLNEYISFQAEGRAFRTMSHHQLPEDERNVQVYRYFSGMPKDSYGYSENVRGEGTTTEEQMYERGMKKMKLTEYVLDIMKRSAFDCREGYNSATINCYKYSENIISNNEGEYDFGD